MTFFLSSYLAEFSVAVGAFVAGYVFGEYRTRQRLAHIEHGARIVAELAQQLLDRQETDDGR